MPADNPTRATRILLIDDDPIIRALMSEVLGSAGYSVHLSGDGHSGLAAFTSFAPDVVLLDVMMPDINGFETCKALRALPRGKYVPIVMVTANDSPSAVAHAFESGATDFASKPLNIDLLIHRIQFVLRAKTTADQLRHREYSLQRAHRLAGLGNWVLDTTLEQIECGDNLAALLSLSGRTISKAQFLNSITTEDVPRIQQFFADLANGIPVESQDFGWEQPTGELCRLSISADLEDQYNPTGNKVSGVVQDNTDWHLAEKKIHTLAYYDAVTGLPNRTFFNKYLVNAIELAQDNDGYMAVLYIDLDHFKRVNDTWGHTTGDEVLRIAAERFKGCLRIAEPDTNRSMDNRTPTGCVARVGGDEFIVVISDLESTNDAALIARRINKAMKEPFQVHDTELYIGSSVGISIFPDDAPDAETLLKQADVAMYEAKRSGRDCYRFFTEDIQDRAFEQLELENRLRHAIEHDQFIVQYQPKISFTSGKLLGIEALVRWQHPDRGLIYPTDFVTLAEETGLIVPLGQWVLETACKQARVINNVLADEIQVAVNLSAMQIRHGNLIRTVQSALHSTGLPPHLLELELTESHLLEDAKSQINLFHQLKKLGVKLSIDDFGTGYSSLRYLKRFPIDALKVDRCFVNEVTSDKADAAIVKSVISLAHNLDLSVVAEGIETTEQFRFLKEQGCDQAQGYLICPALEISDLIIWARQFRTERKTVGLPEPV